MGTRKRAGDREKPWATGMRRSHLAFLLVWVVCYAGASETTRLPPYPLWDGNETIAEYARHTGLAPTMTLQLGDCVTLELVLIPAGTFTMGTPEPPRVYWQGYRNKILLGQGILLLGAGVLAFLLGEVLFEAIHLRRRPQYSLTQFLKITVATAVGLLGGVHWWYTARALSAAKADYATALARRKNPCTDSETAHQVTLTKPFYFGRYEVTQEQYAQVMKSNPSFFKGLTSPVQSVSWYEAYSFCGKTSGNADVTVRLPTEAEWEYACRAGTETLYSSGDPEADLDSVAWYKKNSAGRPQPVGQKQPNVWGLYDIHGNVSEWCEDWCEPSSEEAQQDPGGPPTGENRVIRGGDWHAPSWACRSAFRWSDPPRISGGTCGFRVVVTVTP